MTDLYVAIDPETTGFNVAEDRIIEVGAVRSSMIAAKLNIIPVRRGYWGNKIGLPHTVPMKVTGNSGSVSAAAV